VYERIPVLSYPTVLVSLINQQGLLAQSAECGADNTKSSSAHRSGVNILFFFSTRGKLSAFSIASNKTTLAAG